MPIVGPLTRPELIFPDLEAADPRAVLQGFAERIAAAGVVTDAAALFRALWEREQLGSTAIGHGVALPHCKLKGLEQAVVAVGVVHPGIDFGSPDGAPVAVFFLVLSPAENPAEHLQVLARVSRWVRAAGQVETVRDLAAARRGASRDAIYEYLRESL
jgi:mannitol/fructose-specific phosphotransferase system IIA component (Ntr-type)